MTKKPKHDQIFKKAMENPIVAHEFLRVYLPKDVQDVIDTKTLKLEKDSFLSTELDSSFSDVLFSAKFNGDDGYIFLLLEHQSRPEHLMAFRLFKYMINICEQYLAQHPKAKYLPLIYPCVIYNGTKAYDAPRNIWDLFSNKKLARTIWTDDYQLINVHEIPDTELKKHVWSGILMFFMKHIHERQLLKRWHEIAKLLPIISELTVGTDYIKILLNYTLLSIDKNDKIELENLLISTLNQQTGTEIMGSLAQSWKEEGIQIGKAEGVQIGKAEGEEQKALVIAKNLLAQKIDINIIATVTGLSVDKIGKLKS
jgi:predicted transposase/invertase (TIGR01784 family)